MNIFNDFNQLISYFQLLNIIESNAESNEIEKFKLHINEIDTITSILLKLSNRLAKVENDLSTLSDSDEHTKVNIRHVFKDGNFYFLFQTSLLERREKAQQKHDEAKSLKDGIDRRSRLVTNILRKYFSNEQYDDYEHFIRMKSTLLMDGKDLEENILILEKQIQILNQLLNNGENSLKILSSTAQSFSFSLSLSRFINKHLFFQFNKYVHLSLHNINRHIYETKPIDICVCSSFFSVLFFDVDRFFFLSILYVKGEKKKQKKFM